MRFIMTLLLTALLAGSVSASEVTFQGEGQWASDYRAPSGIRYGWYWNANVWLDLATTPANDQVVGVRWTSDNWQSYEDSYGVLEGVEEGLNLWSIDFLAASMRDCFWCEPLDVTVEYAVFVKSAEGTIWDNNAGENYQIEIDPEYKN